MGLEGLELDGVAAGSRCEFTVQATGLPKIEQIATICGQRCTHACPYKEITTISAQRCTHACPYSNIQGEEAPCSILTSENTLQARNQLGKNMVTGGHHFHVTVRRQPDGGAISTAHDLLPYMDYNP